ncbi:MAG: NINE protein [Gordonia sp. (in: high G+C Gram-positive bacteria)]|uniref:TM2 domain-containing protein n=1 Tax=Gordonia sp. (in: high G+C Gram-positive bacteria) TaxID=84139 RepID=UPI0039E31E84
MTTPPNPEGPDLRKPAADQEPAGGEPISGEPVSGEPVGEQPAGQPYPGQDPWAGQQQSYPAPDPFAGQQPHPGQPSYAGPSYAGQPGAAPYGQPYGAVPAGYGQPAQVGQKSKIVAGILGILLGAFGVHNFYLGYTGKAIAQLLISLLSFGVFSFVSAIWGLIEGILILVSKPGTSWHWDAAGFELQD